MFEASTHAPKNRVKFGWWTSRICKDDTRSLKSFCICLQILIWKESFSPCWRGSELTRDTKWWVNQLPVFQFKFEKLKRKQNVNNNKNINSNANAMLKLILVWGYQGLLLCCNILLKKLKESSHISDIWSCLLTCFSSRSTVLVKSILSFSTRFTTTGFPWEKVKAIFLVIFWTKTCRIFLGPFRSCRETGRNGLKGKRAVCFDIIFLWAGFFKARLS